MRHSPLGIWEAAYGRVIDAEQKLHSARFELDRLKSLNGEANISSALRSWCAAVVVYCEALSEYTALLGSIEFIYATRLLHWRA
jgi:hypothetical protein